MKLLSIICLFGAFACIDGGFRNFGYRLFGCPTKNEVYATCGNCELSCSTIGVYTPSAQANCTAGCYCRPGLARSQTGECVNQKLCPNYRPVCPDHEVFVKCGPVCQHFCDERPCTISAPTELPSGCYCKEDFARDIITQKCIKKRGLTCYAQKKHVYQKLFRHQN